MSIITNTIQESIDLINMQKGLDVYTYGKPLEEGVISWTKDKIQNIVNHIKDLKHYRYAMLQNDTGTWFVIKELGTTEAIFFGIDGTTHKRIYPVNDFDLKVKQLKSDGFNLMKDKNGLYKFIRWYLTSGVVRGVTLISIGALLAILLALVASFPAIAALKVFGITVGAMLSGIGGATLALGMIKGGIFSIAIGAASKATIKDPKKLHSKLR